MAINEDKLKRMNELIEEFKTLYVEMFEDIAKDLEILEILKENADYQYDECFGIKGNQCITIMIGQDHKDFYKVKEVLEK